MKHRKLLAVFTAAVMTVTALPQTAFSVETGDYWTYNSVRYTLQEDGTLAITDCAPYLPQDVVIPPELYGREVTAIADNAFYCETLHSVTIPDSITRIGANAFGHCLYLTTVNMPKQLTELGANAFWGCSSLQSIVIPDGVSIIGEMTFYNCFELSSVFIPDSVTEIDPQAFDSCAMTSIVIPESVESIAQNAFLNHSDDFVICGYRGSVAEYFAYVMNENFMPLNDFTDETTGIMLTADENTLPADTEINITQTETTDVSRIYSITLTQNGEEIQPENDVTIRIPVTEEWSNEKIYVYNKDADDNFIGMNVIISGGYAVFTTNCSGVFVISVTEQKNTMPGDVNGDGIVNELDSVTLARYLAQWNVTIDETAADLDDDGKTGETDSVILARRLAGWNV